MSAVSGTNNQRLKPLGRHRSLKISAIVRFVTAGYLISVVLDGPIRYFLAAKGLTALIYLPKVMLLAAMPALIIYRFRMSLVFSLGMLVVLFWLVWGVADLPSVKQPLFGIWVFVPFIYGLLVSQFVIRDIVSYGQVFLALFLIALFGVLLSPFVTYPWTGQSLDVGGVSVEISRQWTAQGIDRYAGFSRASFSAASQLLCLAIGIVMSECSRKLKFALWLAAGIGIVLTTSKGPFAAWAVLSMFFLSGRISRGSKSWRRGWVAILWGVSVVLVVLPLSTLSYHYDAVLSTPIQLFLLASFGDRLSWMWPKSLGLINSDAEWILGRGVGGIGTAQQYFEPANYFAADNLFVYFAVQFGPLLALSLITFVVRRVTKNFVISGREAATFALFLFMVTYGLVVNIIEDPFLALFLGAVVSVGVVRVKHQSDIPLPD